MAALRRRDTDTFVFLSGGIDSTYVLYKWLKDNPNKEIYVHHVYLVRPRTRADAEQNACMNIIRWLQDNNLNNFQYTNSVIDPGSIKTHINDMRIFAFMHCCVVHASKGQLKKMLVCASKTDFGQVGYIERAAMRPVIHKSVIPEFPIELVYPIKEMSREDIIKDMPPELLALTWYCRRPKRDGSVCRFCTTCKQTNMHLPLK